MQHKQQKIVLAASLVLAVVLLAGASVNPHGNETNERFVAAQNLDVRDASLTAQANSPTAAPPNDASFDEEKRRAVEEVSAFEVALIEQEEREVQRREQQARERSAPPPAPAQPTQDSVAGSGSVWDDLAWCESRGNWTMNSGNGFYGGLQFMLSTWLNMGGDQYAYYPHEATREQQIEVATRLQAQYGWGQWPACSARLGLR